MSWASCCSPTAARCACGPAAPMPSNSCVFDDTDLDWITDRVPLEPGRRRRVGDHDAAPAPRRPLRDPRRRARRRRATPSTAAPSCSSRTRAGSSAAATTTGAPSSSTARSTGAASRKPAVPHGPHGDLRGSSEGPVEAASAASRPRCTARTPGLAHPAMIEHFLVARRHEHRAAARSTPSPPSRACSSTGSRTTGATTRSTSSPRTPPTRPRRAAGRDPRRSSASSRAW